MCIYIYTYIYVCMYVCVSIDKYVYVCVNCVCVTHLHRCKTSMSYLFFHAGGSSTIASLLPTKTLAIGGDTRPDQSGVPAIFHCDGKGLSQAP